MCSHPCRESSSLSDGSVTALNRFDITRSIRSKRSDGEELIDENEQVAAGTGMPQE